jgi:hypothetical protein
VPEQQPLWQESGVHAQLPVEHTWPATHEAFPPQVQTPDELHPSASELSHDPQPTPPVPHADAVSAVVQVSPLQQPVAQLPDEQPLQTPPAEQVPPGQVWHVEPPVPQAEGESPDSQVDPEQQPSGHDVPLHAQLPFTQIWPEPHAVPPPHVHVPPVHPSPE